MERIAVLVNDKNPIEKITLEQLDTLFSTTHKRGGAAIATWQDLGVSGAIANQPVQVVLRDEPTGAPASFQQIVMQGGEFRRDVALMDSYVSVAKNVASDPASISFAGQMYLLNGVKAVPVSADGGKSFVAISSPEADAGLYPLLRPQHMVVNYDPQGKLTDVQNEFMKYVFSQLGQQDVVKSGFDPVSAAPAKIALESVGVNVLH
jgi:phosphate transport system substrate-binding protein